MKQFAGIFAVIALIAVSLLALAVWIGAIPLGARAVYRSGDFLVLEGAIDTEALEMVRRANTGDVRGLRISSDRGSEAAALELAEVVEQQGWEVVVAGNCFDGCALYVLPAATTTVIEEGGLVACGPNVVAGSIVEAAAYKSPPSALDSNLNHRARSLYGRRNVSEAFALNCLARVIPACYTTFVGDDGAQKRGVLTGRRYWSPSRGTLLHSDLAGSPARR